MGIRHDLWQARQDMKSGGAGFALAGLRARGGRLVAPLKVLDGRGAGRGLAEGQVPVALPGGGSMIVRSGDSDFSTLRQVFREHDYDLSRFPAANARLKARYAAILAAGRVPVIVDAGANIGAATVWFKRVFPEAAVVAVEPEPANAALLRLNVAKLSQVVVLEAAIGAQHGFVALANEDQSWGVRTERAEQGLPLVTVDDAVAQVPHGESFIVKVDIEGFESDLFSDNLGWIAHAYAVLIEPHDWLMPGQGSSRSFQRAMAQHDFEILLSGENLVYVRP